MGFGDVLEVFLVDALVGRRVERRVGRQMRDLQVERPQGIVPTDDVQGRRREKIGRVLTFGAVSRLNVRVHIEAGHVLQNTNHHFRRINRVHFFSLREFTIYISCTLHVNAKITSSYLYLLI